jgi:hypothetical protein
MSNGNLGLVRCDTIKFDVSLFLNTFAISLASLFDFFLSLVSQALSSFIYLCGYGILGMKRPHDN